MKFLRAAIVVALSAHSASAAADGDAAANAEAAANAAAAHPNAPPATVFFQNFDGEVAYRLSNAADYVGQDVQVKAVEGR